MLQPTFKPREEVLVICIWVAFLGLSFGSVAVIWLGTELNSAVLIQIGALMIGTGMMLALIVLVAAIHYPRWQKRLRR